MFSFPFLLQAALLFLIVFCVNLLFFKLSLPALLGYLVIGSVFGSFFFPKPNEYLAHVAEIGIVLLFFLLGMEFPVSRLQNMLRQAWIAGSLDLGLNLVISALITLAFGFSFVEALFIGSICYASSSSIIARLLQDTKRIANQETEFIFSILIFEDLCAPVLAAILASMVLGPSPSISVLIPVLLKIILFVVLAVVLAVTVFRKLQDFFTRYQGEEFIDILLITLALGYSGLAVYLGLSEVLGAFLAGLMLAETAGHDFLEPLLLPLRNITLPVFFLVFAAGVDLFSGIPFSLLLLALTLWSVFGKVLVGLFGGSWYKLSPRARWRAGLSLVPRGEFSIIVAGLAVGNLGLWGGLYSMLLAIIGVITFLLAPSLARRLIP